MTEEVNNQPQQNAETENAISAETSAETNSAETNESEASEEASDQHPEKKYRVEWTARTGRSSADTTQVFRLFSDRDSAEHFQNLLKRAFDILQHTSDTEVKLTEEN